MEKARIALGEESEIRLAQRPLIAARAAAHALDQRRRLRLQVDDEIRRRGARSQRLVDLVIERELIARERQARKQRVLVEQEVGDDRPAEHVGLRERLDQPRALEKEE